MNISSTHSNNLHSNNIHSNSLHTNISSPKFQAFHATSQHYFLQGIASTKENPSNKMRNPKSDLNSVQNSGNKNFIDSISDFFHETPIEPKL